MAPTVCSRAARPLGRVSLLLALAGLLLPSATFVRAETPVMSMVPRWDAGYGWQVFYKFRDDDYIGGPTNGQFRRTHEVELGAVYTWDRSIRLVGEVPYYSQTQARIDQNGDLERVSDEGFGNLQLTLPLRRYFNGRGYSGNISFNPRVELPTGDDSGPIGFSDGSTDWGIGLSAERETTAYIIAGGATYWFEGEAGLGNRVSVDAKVGYIPNASMQLTLEFDYDWREDGLGQGFSRFRAGPAWFWWIDRTVLFKVGYNINIHEDRERPSLGGGDEFRVGVGMAY